MMQFEDVTSTVVFVGENFPATFFRASRFSEQLGEADPSDQIITPVISRHRFPRVNVAVGITPNRIDVASGNLEPLPEVLKSVALGIAESLHPIDAVVITGIGINLNVTLAKGSIDERGDQFCRKLIAIPNLEKRLDASELLFTTTRVIYARKEIKYQVEIEPHVKSNGELLHVKANGHQDIGGKERIRPALERYDEIKKYLVSFHEKLLTKG